MSASSQRIGLALSGGGFRATLFHLGVIRGLRELGQLKCVTDVAGVSGGSILAADLVSRWAEYTGSSTHFHRASERVVALTRRDVRNRVLRWSTAYNLTLVPRFFQATSTAAMLEREYRTLFGKQTFQTLRNNASPQTPSLAVLSTSLTSGQIVAFHSDGVTFWTDRKLTTASRVSSNVLGTPLARAVAASAAFPILSSPVPLSASYLGLRKPPHYDHQLTDGGVFDNLGIAWLAVGANAKTKQPLDHLIVSDAGQPFQWQEKVNGFTQNVRANSLLMWRLGDYDLSSFKRFVGHCHEIRIGHTFTPRSPRGFPDMGECLKACQIRTDLNRFSNEDIRLLRKHGRYVALDVLQQKTLCKQPAVGQVSQ